MGGIETKPLSSPGTKQSLDRPKTLTTQKESISRTANSKNILKDKLTTDIKNIFTSKEFLGKKFALSDAWIAKISSSYKKFDTQSVISFLKKTPQFLDARYPKTLFATALIQYASTVQGNNLRPEDFGRYVQTLQDEHTKMQKMYDTFALSKDPAFASFQTFKKGYKTGGQTIDQVAQGKSFSNDTYLFFQYLSSDLFQKNKQSIIGGMSASHRQEFAACLQSNVRIAQIAKVDSKVLESLTTTSTKQEQLLDKNEKNFNTINSAFTKDFTREDGPKQIVEDVNSNVFGTEWLQDNDIAGLLKTWQQKFSHEQWRVFYKRFVSYFPKELPEKDIIQCLVGEKVNPQLIQSINTIFARIVTQELQPVTKNTIQQHVMKLYFEQVSSVLQAGGNIVQLDATGIIYNKDGSIDMGYTTTHGIRGSIHVDQYGKVSVTDMFGYEGGVDQGTSMHIIKRVEQQMVGNGNLPSMKDMMERASLQKDTIFMGREGLLSGNTETALDVDRITPYIITEQDEIARTALAADMGKSLMMTQTTDALYRGVTYTKHITQYTQQDVFSTYIVGSDQFIDTKLNPAYSALQPIRETLSHAPMRIIERWNSAFERLISLYENNPHTTADTLPFSINDIPGKESIWIFLTRFCISQQQFDVSIFENMVQALSLENVLPTSMSDFYTNHPSLFPTKSLFTMRYPELALGDKDPAQVMNNTKNMLDDLRMETDLMQKLS